MAKQVGFAEAISRPRGAKPAKAKLEHLKLTPAENGGHIVEHVMTHAEGPWHEPESHVFGADEGKKLVDHLVEHAKIKLAGEDEPNVAEAEAAKEDKLED